MPALTQDFPLEDRHILLGFPEKQTPIIHDFTQSNLILLAPNGGGRFIFASAIMFDVLTRHFEYDQVDVITDSQTFFDMCPYANRFARLHRYDSYPKAKRDDYMRRLLVVDNDHIADDSPLSSGNTDLLVISKSTKSQENSFALCQRLEGKLPLYAYKQQEFPLILSDSFKRLFMGGG